MENITTSKPVKLSQEADASQRSQPIPPPSHPRQYRAIGLIQGTYTPLEENQITRGKLVTPEGITVDAVILGKVISLIKKHVDLSQSNLWVVYPRTRHHNECLHAQIVGLWDSQILSDADNNEDDPKTKSGYFSIRGEVVFYSPEEEKVIVKIRQSPKQQGEKPKFFKLELKGSLPDKGVGCFWDFQVQLEEISFIIQEATNMGKLLPKKKRAKKLNFQKKVGQENRKKEKPNIISSDKKPSSKPNPFERPKKR